MNKIVFTGNLEECVKHFSGRFLTGLNRETRQRRHAIAELLNIEKQTAIQWFSKFIRPTGSNLTRLLLFLELAGYKVSDHPRLESGLRDLLLIIATRTVSVEEVAKALNVNRDQIFEYILRGAGISAERKPKLMNFLAEYREAVISRLTEMKTGMRNLDILQSEDEKEEGSQPKEKEVGVVPPEVTLLAQLINAAAPLAKRIASDEFTAQSRQLLRQLTQAGSSNNVFELSNSLNQCCGERARAQLESKQ